MPSSVQPTRHPPRIRFTLPVRYVAALFAHSRRNVVFLLAIGLAFHIGLWAFSGCHLRPELADDGPGYIFLATEVMGLMDEPPLFDLRSPGWPMTIAAVLAAVGVRNLWVLSLVMRLALSCWPILAYLALRLHLDDRLAAFASLFILLLPINRHRAEEAYSDVFFATAILVSVAMFLLTLHRKPRWLWASATGLALAYAGLVRPEAFVALPPLALILVAPSSGERALVSRLATALVLVFPSVVGIGAWGSYNRAQLGSFSLASVGWAGLSTRFAVHATLEPRSEEIVLVGKLLPEVADDQHVLYHWHDWHVGRYRAGQGLGVRGFDELVAQIGLQRVQSNPGDYMVWVGENVLYALLFPLPSPSWLPDNSEHRDYVEARPAKEGGLGVMPFSFGSRVKLASNDRFVAMWEGAKFSLWERSPYWELIWAIIDPILFFWFLPLLMGIVGLLSMAVLMLRPPTRLFGLTLFVVYASVNLGVFLFALRMIRYLYYTHAVVFLAVMTVIGQVVEAGLSGEFGGRCWRKVGA